MPPLLRPVQMLLLMFAGWVNRHQLDVIEYLQEENRVLKERMGGRRLRFTDAQDNLLYRYLLRLRQEAGGDPQVEMAFCSVLTDYIATACDGSVWDIDGIE